MHSAKEWQELVSLIIFAAFVFCFGISAIIDCDSPAYRGSKSQCIDDKPLFKVAAYIPFVAFRFMSKQTNEQMPRECALALHFMAAGFIFLLCYRNSDLYFLPFGLACVYDFYVAYNRPKTESGKKEN